jgi:mannose-binding lectin 1
MDDWFETDSQRELRQIFQGQNQIFQVVRELNNKLDEVVGRQERTMSLISQTSGGVAAPSATGHAPAPPGGFPDTIRRHEVDAVFNNQNQILSTVREIRCDSRFSC